MYVLNNSAVAMRKGLFHFFTHCVSWLISFWKAVHASSSPCITCINYLSLTQLLDASFLELDHQSADEGFISKCVLIFATLLVYKGVAAFPWIP